MVSYHDLRVGAADVFNTDCDRAHFVRLLKELGGYTDVKAA